MGSVITEYNKFNKFIIINNNIHSVDFGLITFEIEKFSFCRAKKAGSIEYGNRNCRTRARDVSQLENGNNRNKAKQKKIEKKTHKVKNLKQYDHTINKSRMSNKEFGPTTSFSLKSSPLHTTLQHNSLLSKAMNEIIIYPNHTYTIYMVLLGGKLKITTIQNLR